MAMSPLMHLCNFGIVEIPHKYRLYKNFELMSI